MQVLFGGTFDPVHDGHVAMAKMLLATFIDAQVHVIPNSQPPHRVSSESSIHRFKMLEIAMQDVPGVTVNPIEKNRPGPSYAIDTLQQFRSHFGQQESLVLCLGADVVGGLEHWYEKQYLVSLCHLCILSRAGEMVSLPDITSAFFDTDDLDLLSNQSCGLLYRLSTPDIPVSSTAVRRLVMEKANRLPVPSKIADYINQHQLYKDVK